MAELDKMLDWLLRSNSSECHGSDDGDGNGNVQQLNNESSLQISVSENCSTELFCNVPMASQLDPQASLNELGLDSPSLNEFVLVPNSVDQAEHLCSRVCSSSNLIVHGMDSGGWASSRRDYEGERVQKITEAKEKTTEDAKLWRKNNYPRKQHRNAEKHSQAEKGEKAGMVKVHDSESSLNFVKLQPEFEAIEKKRRQKINQRIRILQSLIPDVDKIVKHAFQNYSCLSKQINCFDLIKIDTASILVKAIDYVKSLQLHVNGLLDKINPTATPLGTSTAALQSFQLTQSGSMEATMNEKFSLNDRQPLMPRSLSIPPLPSSQAMAQCHLSRASSLPQFHEFPSLPSPLFQMPHQSTTLQYEGLQPPCLFGPVALGIPTTLNHQQLPLQTQDVEETSNTNLGNNNWGTGLS